MTIPNSVTSIGNKAFDWCEKLDSVFVQAFTPPTTTDNLFYTKPVCYIPCGTEEEYLNSTWANNVSRFEVYDFLIYSGKCGENLYWNYEDSKLTITGEGAMSDCIFWELLKDSITTIEIADGVTNIAEDAFSNCSQLTQVILGNSIEEVGDYAFYKCVNLQEITLTGRVRNIGKGAFEYCTELKKVTFGNSIEKVGGSAFYECVNLQEITLTGKVRNIGAYAFGHCTELKKVTFENSIEEVGDYAFYKCEKLKEVTLGVGIQEIGDEAFANCRMLYDIYCYASFPPAIDKSSFTNYNAYVHVPCESMRYYQADMVWSEFKNLQCINSENVETNSVIVTPTTNTVTITWPMETGANNYSIILKNGDEVFCTLNFNAEGQLLNIAFAPSRDRNNHGAQYAEQATNGYRFTVIGLEEATKYTYNIEVKDASDKTIKSYSGDFTTESLTAVEDITTEDTSVQKLIRDDQLIIVVDGVEYNIMGNKL